MSDPDYELISRAQLVKDLEEAEAFLKSRLFQKFILLIDEKKGLLNQSILHSPPVTPEHVALLQQTFGARDNCDWFRTIFEEHRTGLEQLLSNLDESQQSTVRQ